MPGNENVKTSNTPKNGLRNAAIIVGALLIAYGMANLEVVRRAHAAYVRGENHFKDKKFKEAMWDYQEVQEFYYLPHTHWVDLSAEKEFVCRAFLGDWIPPEGPLDADVRQTRADEYEKFKAELAQITPVGDTTYMPAPLTTAEKEPPKKTSKKK